MNKTNHDCLLSLTAGTSEVALTAESRFQTKFLKKEMINIVDKWLVRLIQ